MPYEAGVKNRANLSWWNFLDSANEDYSMNICREQCIRTDIKVGHSGLLTKILRQW